ncbi:vomeronasal type-2 receptor 26-like [Leptodactylus fuscus]
MASPTYSRSTKIHTQKLTQNHEKDTKMHELTAGQWHPSNLQKIRDELVPIASEEPRTDQVDSCNHVNKGIDSVLQILSGPGDTIPNYCCEEFGDLVGVIGDINPDMSFYIAQTLAIFGYVQDGDLIIRGVFTVSNCRQFYNRELNYYASYCDTPVPRFYRYLMALVFAIEEISKNPDILPNVTLGYHVYDSCNNVNKAIECVLQILSGPGDAIPNYYLEDFGHLVGVIGDKNPDISLSIAQMLRVFGYSQISYGAVDPILSNFRLFPSFFQALPNYSTQCLAIVHLLRHYNWTWIGVITSDDDVGEKQSQELKAMAAHYEICVEYIIKIYDRKEESSIFYENITFLKNSTSQVVVICGKFSVVILYFIELEFKKADEKTFIVPAGWMSHMIIPRTGKPKFHGSLVFSFPIKEIPDLKLFLREISLRNRPHDILVEQILAYTFQCLTSDPINNKFLLLELPLWECNRTIKLGELSHNLYDTERFGVTYLVYKSVYAMAHSLHEMQIQMSGNIKDKYKEVQLLMKKNLRRIHFRDPTGEDVYFNEKGEMSTIYHLLNYASPKEGIMISREVGHFNVSSQEGNQLRFNSHKIVWKNSDIPVSTCSEQCPPGYKRAIKPGIHKCCSECLRCSEGEISNKTDSVSCHKCPEDQWPNDMTQCLPKPIEFLSYNYCDTTALSLSSISSLCFFKTSTILGIFILFRDTPVVRANNQTLSFILLASIMLSFLCVFLFLGRPTHVSCMLRQTSFGIIFSVAISSILAKTILVYMAFKATKPGSSWRKFIGVKIPNCVVFFCSFLQVLLSITWLSTSPPFPEMNTHFYQDKIIFQCNEGSMLAFSILLGYMGLLAAVSFMVAFLARNLPDSFNEAKNITFSMLVVCSVWVAFIPAYMSVTGKNTVLVEIFAIISSSVGILGCIFFPKCYIILVRPELNSKCRLSRKIKANPLKQCKRNLISPSQSQKFISSPQCSPRKRWTLFNAKYIQDGDLIIGGIFTVSYYELITNAMNEVSCYCHMPIHRFYRYLMAFIFAIDEINKNPDILPNVTLGYHVYDSCNNVNNAIDSVLQILSGPGDAAPNYCCMKFGHLVGVIGDMNSEITLTLAHILSLYGYAQEKDFKGEDKE